MVLLCGIPSESPVHLVNKQLMALGAETVIFSQRQVLDANIDWRWQKGKAVGSLDIGGCSYALENFKGIYLRFMEASHLPEVKEAGADGLKHSTDFHEKMFSWLEVNENRVVNKHTSMYSNSSKPLQAQIIKQYGLSIPPTLITNDLQQVKAFKKIYNEVIFKSISGVRSIVKKLEGEFEERLSLIKHCPVQFQARVQGHDVRVHVIGNKVFPTKITTTGVDYRYAHKEENGDTDLEPYTIPKKIEDACIKLTAALGLHFSGIDLREGIDGNWYCFEVNPMPGYSYYENNTGQAISAALANYLCGKEKVLVA
jgi:glutathione synthase/RimK-type ligase-like ATP-grasp enzyme